MIGGGFRDKALQTFYASREKTNSPFVPDIIKTNKNLKNLNKIDKKSLIVISQRYGKRILITSEVEDFSDLKHDELIEIVDYDPLKNTLLILGPKNPILQTPVHWMIQHARNEINSIVQINDSLLVEKLKNQIPTTEHDFPTGSIDQIKDILKKLSSSKIVVIKNQSVIFVGESLKEVEKHVVKTLGEIK